MAPRKKVPTLLDLSIESLQKSLTEICCSFTFKNPDPSASQRMIESIKILLQGQITPKHHNQYAKICLQALDALFPNKFIGPITKEVSDKREEIGGLLLSEFIRLKPTSFDVNKRFVHSASSCGSFSKIVDVLPKMRNLRIFKSEELFIMKSGKLTFCNKVLVAGPLWTQLTSFTLQYYCTNKMISLISQNCPLLIELDVDGSDRITDRSIQSLKNFCHLQTLILSNTSITGSGLSHFFLGSKSQNLRNVECRMVDNRNWSNSAIFGEAMHRMDEPDSWDINEHKEDLPERVEPLPTLQIQRVVCGNLSKESLALLCKFVPNLQELEINFEYEAPKLTRLTGLKKLKKLGLSLACRSPESLLDAIPAVGTLITSLDIAFAEQSELDRCLDVIISSCPNVESLDFSQLEPLNDYITRVRPELEFQKPFQKLKSLFWRGCLQTSYAAFILKYACNIETIHLEVDDDDSDFITDEFFESLLVFNPLRQLRKLDSFFSGSFDLSDGMFKKLVSDCDNLSEINCCLGTDNLKALETFIKDCNYDVKIL